MAIVTGQKAKSGFRDWTDPENNINFCTGCENNCIYCYAKFMAYRRGQVNEGHWHEMIIREKDVDKKRNLRKGIVGFPSTHDILPTNLEAYLIVLGKLLRAGNEVLIVSKPRLECIKRICEATQFFKDKILFRFTIGAMDDDILSFWEPNAPKYHERKACLKYALNKGFRTSVSMEPMLDSLNIEAVVNDLSPFVSKDIWLGTMNHLGWIKKGADERLLSELKIVEAGQTPEKLLEIDKIYENNPKIKWKTEAHKEIEKAKEKGKVGISESRVKKGGRNRWYELTSALQKSIRWCEVNESRYFARELMYMGYPGGVLNQLILIAAEDVGLADPSLVEYERGCLDRFDNLIKQFDIKKREAVKFPPLCNIVDRAVIAAAISYKSRLLPQLSFATLFDIYENEDFSKNWPEYFGRFVKALRNKDEKQATYDAYVLAIFLNSEDKILKIVQKHSGMRNKDLIQKWVEEYKRNNELLMLAGSIALLCRDLQNPHGEYNDNICQHLSSPIKKAEIPDRAYDMHTIIGKRMRRGLEHFFDEAATVKNERFPNNWGEAGKTAYFSADQKGLAKAVKIIEAIKKNYEKSKKSQKREGIYSSASV
jgi:DNA repair photolyase